MFHIHPIFRGIIFKMAGSGRRPECGPGNGRDRAEREDAARSRDDGATPLPRERIQQGGRLSEETKGSGRVYGNGDARRQQTW